MVVNVEVSGDRTTWTDISGRVTRLTHKLTGRELEAVDFDVVEPSTTLAVGMYVRVKRGASTVFEGIIYEVSRRRGEGRNEYTIRAYSELVLYDRRVVFRNYQTGTSAGDIIKDLAALETGVDVTNVDVGPSLTSPWEIQNEKALEIMQSTARGTNYYIRMRPGRVLYFKPKQVGTPKITFDDTNVLESEYSEDRWKLKNRVIYVGANGQVLADVSEPPGDLPVVVHDPFLTDENEANRRAQIRLALNKEFGRELRLTVRASVVESAGLDLFDTVRVNIPGLGLSNVDMFIVEMEYEPLAKVYKLTVGGRLELFEEFFDEAIGSDVASRFGSRPDIVGEIYDIKSTLFFVRRLASISTYRYIAYLNKRPITVHAGVNIRVNSLTGEVELASGFTSGYAEIRFLPPSEKFRRWGYVEWVSYQGDGNIIVKLMDAQGNVMRQMDDWGNGWGMWKRLQLARWPRRAQAMTRYPEVKNWDKTGTAQPLDVRVGFLTGSCIRLEPSSYGTMGEIIYPSAKNLGLDLSWAKYISLFLYTFDGAVTFKVRLYTDQNNYHEGVLSLTQPNMWKEYVINVSSLSKIGVNADLANVNWLGFFADYPVLIDSDYVFHQYGYEELRVRFEMSRPSATSVSPRISKVLITYEEAVA
jgi:hypothetical protein